MRAEIQEDMADFALVKAPPTDCPVLKKKHLQEGGERNKNSLSWFVLKGKIQISL